MSGTPEITFVRDGGVGVLTLNRPERLNSLSGAMMRAATGLMDELVAGGAVRALILTGAGRGFCSGADLGGDTRFEDSQATLAGQMRDGLNRFVAQLSEAPFPVITAVNGPAAGAGVGIALAGDILIAGRSMKLLLSFARIGMGLDAGTSKVLPEVMGPRRAMSRALLMEPIGPEEALDLGIAWAVAPDPELMDQAMVLARRLAEGPPLAFAAIKRQLRAASQMTLREALDAEAQTQGELIRTEDMREGVAAYREKRPARFFGR